MRTEGFFCNCAVATHCASWTVSANTEICTSTTGAEMRWVNSHSYISAWFQPSSPNQCWGFVSKGLQNCPHITTLWSATLSLEKATGSTFYTNAQAYRVLWNTVGGHGGQVCNKDLQTVYVLVTGTSGMHSGCRRAMAAVQSNCSFICRSHMWTKTIQYGK